MKIGKCLSFAGLVALVGCGEASHLGNPLTLPVRAVGSVVSEVNYQTRRSDVKQHLTAHAGVFQSGPIPAAVAQDLFRLARTRPEHEVKVLREIRSLAPGPEWAEQATVIAMVHG